MKSVTIIDYGIGNIFNVIRAFERVGSKPILTKNPEEILKADRLCLPGVGAFGESMKNIRSQGLTEAISQKANRGTPFLGICVGMQLLHSTSEEFGNHEGLNLIEGSVLAFKPPGANDDYRVPHIGWNPLLNPHAQSWQHGVLKGIEPGDSVYFVHSFYASPKSEKHILASSEYAGVDFAAFTQKDNIMGAQFHLERSGPLGLRILSNFLTI